MVAVRLADEAVAPGAPPARRSRTGARHASGSPPVDVELALEGADPSSAP